MQDVSIKAFEKSTGMKWKLIPNRLHFYAFTIKILEQESWNAFRFRRHVFALKKQKRLQT